jgi:thymidine phosphorylase
MEVLADVVMPMHDIKKVVDQVGGCMVWGGAVNLAPADDKFITVEHPLSIDAEAQLLASILAKKGSVSATHVLIDIPVGKGAKIKDASKAKHLKTMFEKIGKQIGMEIHCMITDGSQPIGNGIGPALEAIDVLKVLRNDKDAPQDLKKKSLEVAGRIMTLYPLPYWKAKHGQKCALEMLESGKAYATMKKLIAAQGKKADTPEHIKVGKFTYAHTAWKDGTVKSISNEIISKIAKNAGAPGDKGSGLYLHHHVGDRVKKHDPLFTVYAESKQKLTFAKDCLRIEDGIEIEGDD